MVNIIYRNYKKADEIQLTHLFNRAFQMNGGGFVRTSKGLNWRYMKSPNFDPEMVQIAEDTEERRIVGAIYVNLIEKIKFNERWYLVAEVNDVTSLPEYTQMGIATNLMQKALKFMEEKGCDLSILSADPKGIARKMIYLKFGYRDFDHRLISFGISKPRHLIKNFPIFAALIPLFLCYSYLPRFVIKIQLKLNRTGKALSYKIFHNKGHNIYREAANNIIPKYYNGFSSYSRKKMLWAFIQAPSKRHFPSYILIYKDNKVIGGARITYKNIYAFKYGIKIRVGIIHEIFMEKNIFHTKRDLKYAYKFLIDKVMKAAREKNIGGIFYNGSVEEIDLLRAFRYYSFLSFKSGVIMIKKLKTCLKSLKNEQPLFIPTYISLGFP
jgi:predicted N-acetyltransferase YhbS